MKVLLCEDVKELGWLGDVVEVNTGYARNYLLPQRLAIVPTDANLRSLAKEAAKRADERKLDRQRMEKVAASVEGAEVVIAAKANEQGVLFGSVGAGEIAENLRAQGFVVADGIVRLAEHIKQVGTHEVTLKFDKDLTATVKVTIVAYSAEVSPEAEEDKPDDQNG
ncbi:MAG: 50S ribosomal protein L9 [Phycisphaerae bacterium]|nr:50S ribosomal protein L9 [Phycisphaerae bacterium]